MLKSPSQNGDLDSLESIVGGDVPESEDASVSKSLTDELPNQSDVMDVDEMADVGNDSSQNITSRVKSEPVDRDLLLDEELRLQIEKSIEMVVNECSLIESLVERTTAENAPSEMPIVTAQNNNANGPENVTVSSSSCVKGIADLPPKIRNDITVIPLNNRVSNIKSEPRDGLEIECKRKLPIARTGANDGSSYSSYLSSISTGKHSSLTILPVTTSSGTKIATSSTAVKNNSTSKNRNDCVEFSLTPDVTIKTVMAGNVAPAMTLNKVNPTDQSFPSMCPPKLCTSGNADQSGAGTSRCNVLAPNPFNVPGPQPICYDSAMKHIVDSLPASVPCSTFNTANNCLYNKASNSTASLPSCSFTTSYPKPCSSGLSSISVPSTALVPYQQNSSFCNFNSFNQPVPQLASPKHSKAPINALNPCRMSSSPVPAFVRSKEYGSSPLLCNIISESLANMLPPESPSFKTTPSWTPSSFRSPTSPASLNFPLPSPTVSSQNTPNVLPPYNQSSGSLMLPVNQTKPPVSQNNFNSYRPSYTPFTPNSSFQRAQCCFSSQIQCFNAGCASSSQQQFSIVQHSTRLSNLKSNSMDSVSSLLQYHTYFKKY